MTNAKICFKCGSLPSIVSDDEITCSNKNCSISTKSFSIEDWNTRIIAISPEYVQSSIIVFSSVINSSSKIDSVFRSILSGSELDNDMGLPTPAYILTLIGELNIIKASSQMLKAILERMVQGL